MFLNWIFLLLLVVMAGTMSTEEEYAVKHASRGMHDCVLADSYLAAPLQSLLCVFVPTNVELSRESGDWVVRLQNLMFATPSFCQWAVVVRGGSIPQHGKAKIEEDIKKAAVAAHAVVVGFSSYEKDSERDAALLQFAGPYRRVALFTGFLSLSRISHDNFISMALECAYWPRSSPLVFQLGEGASPKSGKEIVMEFGGPSSIDGVIVDACFLAWLHGPVRELANTTYSILEEIIHTSPTMLCQMARKFWQVNYRGLEKAPYRHVDCASLLSDQVQPKSRAPIGVSVDGNNITTLRRAFPTWATGAHAYEHESLEKIDFSESCRPLNMVRLPMQEKGKNGEETALGRKHGKGTGGLASRAGPRGKNRAPLRRGARNKTPQEAKIYALFFPQFHRDALNDKLWGANYTDWIALNNAPEKNRLKKFVLRPTTLGEYDLADAKIRSAQAALAKQYDVDGFIYHHYWFYVSETNANHSNQDSGHRIDHFNLTRDEIANAPLAAPLAAMLQDGSPDINFALHWANNDWTATWQGRTKKSGEMLLKQNYPHPDSPLVLKHYQFLRKFFNHPNYIKVRGAPLLLVYLDNTENHNGLHAILRKLRDLARQDGYPNLHIPRPRLNSNHPSSIRSWWTSKTKYTLSSEADRVRLDDGYDADLYYPGRHDYDNSALPMSCMAGQNDRQKRPEYLGMVSVFDNTPRRDFHAAKIWDRRSDNPNSVKSFENDLFIVLVYEKCCQAPAARDKGGRVVLLNAWNEWGEGMALEPSNKYGTALLEAIKAAKERARHFVCFS